MPTQNPIVTFRKRCIRHAPPLSVALVLSVTAPTFADSLSFTYDSTTPGVSVTSTALTLEGSFAMGQVGGTSAGSNVTLTGNSIPPTMPDIYKPAVYLTAAFAMGNLYAVPYSSPLPLLPTLYFQWGGNFDPLASVNANDPLDVQYSVPFALITSSTDPQPISWFYTLYIADDDGNPFLAHTSTLQTSTNTSNNDPPITDHLFFDTAGTPTNWTLDLYVQWGLPTYTSDSHELLAKYPTDTLSVSPLIVMGPPGGGSTPDGPTTPLPSVFWSGASLFSLCGLLLGGRRLALRNSCRSC